MIRCLILVNPIIPLRFAVYNWKFIQLQYHLVALNRNAGCSGYLDNFCKLKYSEKQYVCSTFSFLSLTGLELM